MSLFDLLGAILGTVVSKTRDFSESETGQMYRAASSAKRANDDMNQTLKEMDELNKSLYDDD